MTFEQANANQWIEEFDLEIQSSICEYCYRRDICFCSDWNIQDNFGVITSCKFHSDGDA